MFYGSPSSCSEFSKYDAANVLVMTFRLGLVQRLRRSNSALCVLLLRLWGCAGDLFEDNIKIVVLFVGLKKLLFLFSASDFRKGITSKIKSCGRLCYLMSLDI